MYCMYKQYCFKGMKFIPIPISAGITGFESPCQEYSQLSINLNDLIEHPSSSFLGVASGDSMIEVGVFDGDLLLVDRNLNAKTGDVIVGNLNGELCCKVLDIERRLLISANRAYKPVVIDELDSFSIEGVVSKSIRCHRPTYLLANHQ